MLLEKSNIVPGVIVAGENRASLFGSGSALVVLDLIVVLLFELPPEYRIRKSVCHPYLIRAKKWIVAIDLVVSAVLESKGFALTHCPYHLAAIPAYTYPRSQRVL
jgi:hypothetical protein